MLRQLAISSNFSCSFFQHLVLFRTMNALNKFSDAQNIKCWLKLSHFSIRFSVPIMPLCLNKNLFIEINPLSAKTLFHVAQFSTLLNMVYKISFSSDHGLADHDQLNRNLSMQWPIVQLMICSKFFLIHFFFKNIQTDEKENE